VAAAQQLLESWQSSVISGKVLWHANCCIGCSGK